MNVGKLMFLLDQFEEDTEVLLASDSEGSYLQKVDEFSWGVAKWDGEEWMFGIPELTEELKTIGFTEDDIVEDGVPTVIIFPHR